MINRVTTEKQAVQLAHIIITAQILLNRLSDYKSDYKVRQELKLNINRLLDTLTKIEIQCYDDIYGVSNEQVSKCYDVKDKFIARMSRVDFSQMDDIILITDAYEKDPRSIEGIIKKILR